MRSLGSGLARSQNFAKGEELQPQVFHKYIKIGRRGEQISATQTYHKWGPSRRRQWGFVGRRLWGPVAGRFFEIQSYFKAIWITFRTFSEPFQRTKL